MGRIDSSQTSISQDLHILLESIGQTKRISEGVHLFHEGTPAEYIYLVKSGLIQISKSSQDGKELTLRICQQEAIIGELVLFSHDATYLLNAKALRTSTVYSVCKEELEKILATNNALAVEFMTWSTNHMRVYQYKIRDLLMYGKKGALYSTLIRLTNSYGITHPKGIEIDVALTDSELAAFAAATRESANRALIDLRERNVVSRLDSGKLLIKDLEYLRQQIGCDECPLGICHID